MDKRIKREQLYQFLEENPLVEERLMAIIDLSENVDGRSIIADEVEERLITEMQQLGNGFLTAWTVSRENQSTQESHLIRRHTKHTKKNFIS